MRITKKKQGGDVNPNSIFKKILSIGYELETPSLAKLSMIDNLDDGEPILFNTDSLTKDYEIIKRIKRIQNNDYTEEEYEYYANRLEEFVDANVYTSAGLKKNKLIQDTTSTFLISNDLSETAFVKNLKTICNLSDNTDDEDLIDKNDLYTFEAENGEKYKVNFETWQHKHCGMFSDVEWIFTYYNPVLSKNIILDTFINVAKI